MTRAEWRAVFSYPSSILGPTADSYGKPRPTREQAEADRCPRSEETLGWRSGLETRVVTPWRPADGMNGAGAATGAPEAATDAQGPA